MAKGLSPTQIRLLTGGFRRKSGKVTGGMVLPKDVERDRKMGFVTIQKSSAVGSGVVVKATRSGKLEFAKRLKSL